MPSVFISYRRDDTAGAAGHLADDLGERFGRSRVFIDVDSIPLATNFEDRIHAALDSCQVVLVLIGTEWLTARLPSGERRIDDEHDYLRQEVAAALEREDVAVIPVLVDGASMPSPEDLPSDISELAKINALDLNHKRWHADLGTLCEVAQRYDKWWSRVLNWLRAHAVPTTLIVALAVVIIAGAIIVSTRSDGPSSDGETQPNPVAYAALLEQGPFTEELPDGLKAGGLTDVDVADASAAGSLSTTELNVSTKDAPPGIGGVFAHFEVYPTPEDAVDRAEARIALLRRIVGPEKIQGDASAYCSYQTIGAPTSWECGGTRGLVYAEATVTPNPNANQSIATETTTALLNYADEKARVARE
jgi:TIR domain